MFMYSTRQEKDDANQVYLSGEIVEQPIFSHEVFRTRFLERLFTKQS